MKRAVRQLFSLRHIIVILILAIACSIFSQEQKPFKTGLVLSGGGAKGLAHIGLLQIIDSLEIKVDYMTGTSMGAIVGGLYSAGYSADDIYKIIHDTEWEYILSNRIPLNRVHINEKENYSNYLLNLPIKNHLPTIPASFVEGQHLSEMLSNYLFATRNTFDFHKLPIPLEIIAADILTGKKVVLKDGYLPIAIRASMAIPAFFAPVNLDEYLLVDGGLRRNFPVEEVKKMGADFIVGSYTGFRIIPAQEMDNALNAVYQSFALDAVEDATHMMEQTDISLDFTETLKEFGTQSFNDHNPIIQIGQIEARKLLPQLIELKRKQTEAGIQYSRESIKSKHLPVSNVNTLTSLNESLNENEREVILAVLDTTHRENLDSVDYLNSKINQLFSHLDYSKIYYTFSPNDDNTKNLNLFFKETMPSLQMAIHYDTYELAGIVLRYNRKNLLFDNSKLSVNVDLSNYFKANAYYLKYLNNKKNTWAKLQYDFRRQKNNDMLFKMVSQMMFFTEASIYNSYHSLDFSIGYSPTIASSITAGLEYKFNRFRKESGIYAKQEPNSPSSAYLRSLYDHQHTALWLKYNRNTFNASWMPTEGNRLEIGTSLFFNNHLKLNKPDAEDQIGMQIYDILNPTGYNNAANAKDPVLQLWINEHAMIPLAKKLSLRIHGFAGANLSVGNNGIHFKHANDYMFLSQKFNLGGYHNYSYDKQVPYPGLSINELKINNLSAVTVGVQWNALRKLYITPNIAMATAYSQQFTNRLIDNVLINFGTGVDIDYQTIIGPLKLSINIPWMSTTFFFSLGYQF